MSPQLLGQIYGSAKWQGERMGGYRPNVFFWSGIELGLWMTAVSLTAWWFWRCGVIKKLDQSPWKSTAPDPSNHHSLLPLDRGNGSPDRRHIPPLGIHSFPNSNAARALLLVGPFYVALRVPNIWSGQQLVDLAEMSVGQTPQDHWNIASNARTFSSPALSNNRYLVGEDGVAVPPISRTTVERSRPMDSGSSLSGPKASSV